MKRNAQSIGTCFATTKTGLARRIDSRPLIDQQVPERNDEVATNRQRPPDNGWLLKQTRRQFAERPEYSGRAEQDGSPTAG